MTSTTTNIYTLNDLKNALPQAGEFLGSILGWVVPDIEPNTISHTHLVDLAYRYSVSEELLPPDVKITKAFTRTVNATKKSLSKTAVIDYAKKPTDDDPRFVLGIINKTVDGEENLNYSQQAKIVYNTETDNWSLNNSEHQNVLIELQANLERFRKHTSEDVRYVLRTFAKKYAIRLNPEGKSYFVPRHNQDLLKRVQMMMETLTPENIILHIPLFSTPETQQSLNVAAKATLEAEINEVHDELNHYLENAKCSDYLFNKGLEMRYQNIEELENRVNIFDSVLTFQATSLKNKLAELKYLVGGSEVRPIDTESNELFEGENYTIELSDGDEF